MTAPDVAARVTAWLDRLEGLHTAATPGPWSAEPNYRREKPCRCGSCWEPIEGSWDINPVDGPDCPEHGCWHNIAVSEADAAAIVAEHNAMPALLALARGVTELANTFTELADLNADRADDHEQAERHVDAQYRHGRAVSYLQAATALRDLLADAAPDTGEETA